MRVPHVHENGRQGELPLWSHARARDSGFGPLCPDVIDIQQRGTEDATQMFRIFSGCFQNAFECSYTVAN